MEFNLNKIDTDIRRKMQENIKEGKVHPTKKTNEDKDIIDEKEFEEKSTKQKDKNDSSKNNKKYIIIESTKYDKPSIKIEVEKLESISEVNSKGRILDAKK